VSDKFQNKYQIPSARAKWWDYGLNAAYFVTICTHSRKHFFGEIVETPYVETPNLGVSTMKLSGIGEIAQKHWLEIPNHFPFILLDSFVIMPNHVHGILILNKPDGEYNDRVNVETPNLGVSTTGANKNWYPGTLGVVINQYKRICTINARKINSEFAWQTRFYDHIIRNEDEYQRIAQYIETNLVNWTEDKFFNP
jgi:putative transposase